MYSPCGCKELDTTEQLSLNKLKKKKKKRPQTDNRFTPTRTATNTDKTDNNKCWQGCGEIGILVRCWWEPQMENAAAGETSVEVLKN